MRIEISKDCIISAFGYCDNCQKINDLYHHDYGKGWLLICKKCLIKGFNIKTTLRRINKK